MKSKKTKNHFSIEEGSNAFTFIKNRFFISPEKSPRASTSSSRGSSLDLLDEYDDEYEDDHKEGYLLKKTDFKYWKLYRAVLRGHKLYLYKPMSSESPLYKSKDYDFDREAQEVLFTTPTQGTVFMELDQNMQPIQKVQLVITEQDVTCTRLGAAMSQQQWPIDSIKLDYTQPEDEEEEEEEEEDQVVVGLQVDRKVEEEEERRTCSMDNHPNGHSDMMSLDSNGPLPFSITLHDDTVFYFSTIHRELGQAWISHLQQKLNDLPCSMTSSSTTDCSSHHISSSFSSSNQDTDEDISHDDTITLSHLVQTLLFTSTDNECIHVFLTTYSLFSTSQQVLDELKKTTNTERLLLILRIWCQSYATDIDEHLALSMIALLETLVKNTDLQVLQVKELILKTVANNKVDPPIQQQQDDQPLDEEEECELIDSTLENIRAKDKRRDSINMSNLLISGLLPELFLITDPTAFAEQVYIFHQMQYHKYKAILTNYTTYLPNKSIPPLDYTLLFSLKVDHFLTRFIQTQVLAETSLLTRSALLEQWIRVGSHVRTLGDMTGFYAIAFAVCSPCISRLKETWKAIDREILDIVSEWSLILADPFQHDVMMIRLPYLGVLKQIFAQLEEKLLSKPGMIDFSACKAAYTTLKEKLDPYPRIDEHVNFPIVSPIQSFFEHAASTMTPPPVHHLKYLHDCSLVCEPKLLGQGFDGSKKFLTSSTFTNIDTTFQFPQILDSCQLLDPLSLMLDEDAIQDKLTIHSYSSEQPPAVIKKSFVRKRSLSLNAHLMPSQMDSEKTLLDSLITGQSIQSLAQQTNTNDVVLTVQQGELTFRATLIKSSIDMKNDSALVVFVKSGHLESLVDLLVFGINDYIDQLKDQYTILSKQQIHSVKMDDEDYVTVFFSSYRIFCSSTQLFDMLRKRFINKKQFIQLRILNLLYYWLEEHDYDFMDDLELLQLMSDFLTSLKKKSMLTAIKNRVQQIQQKMTIKSTSPFSVLDHGTEMARSFEHLYQALTMEQQHFRISLIKDRLPICMHQDAGDLDFVAWDQLSPETLLDQLDECVQKAFCAVTLHDWIQMFDVMEAQVSDVYAWLPARKPSRTSRMPLSLNLITRPLEENDENQIISDMYTMIEGARRSIVSPSAFSDDDLLLAFPYSIQYLYTLHYVMRYWVIQEIASTDINAKARVLRIEKFLQIIVILSNECKIPGFVEYTIASALVSPEVRLFSKAWNDVAVQHGNASLDTLQNVLIQIQKMQPTQYNTSNVVPSLSWILERVLELKGNNNEDMIPFEQRHYMVDFIHWLMGLQLDARKKKKKGTSHFSFQLTVSTETTIWKDLREFANKENKRVRHRLVFSKLVFDQIEKRKRDYKERDRIDKEWLNLQHKLQKKQVEQQIRNNKMPRLNSFLKGFRNNNTSMTITLNNAMTYLHSTNKRDFVFRVMTEDNTQYLFQAMSREDMQDWMRHINMASMKTEITRTDGVYGIALELLMSHNRIPIVIEKCISEIEKRGLEEVGIYRVAGTGSVVTALKTEFNKDPNKVDLSNPAWADINVVADAFKQFLRELPEPLLTYAKYNEFINASTLEDHDERVYLLKQVVKKLPLPNYTLLKRIIEHFLIVTAFETTNHMYATNLAIVFGPTLLQPSPSPSSFATTMTNLAHHQNTVKYLILNYHYLFDVENSQQVAGPQVN